MTTKPKSKKVDFFLRPFRESLNLIRYKLSGTAFRIIEFMSACCTFEGEAVFMPPAKELKEILDVSLSTIYNCLDKIQEVCSFIHFKTNSDFILAYRGTADKKFWDFKNSELFPIQKNHFQNFRKLSEKPENEQLELPLDKDYSSPQTIQKVQTPQTGGRAKEVKEQSPKVKENSSADVASQNNIKYSLLPNHLEKKKDSEVVTTKKYNIPEDLAERLRMAEIPLSEQLLVKVSKYHISQAYGAITHVENTAETIRDPKAVFLHQISRQPIEKLGQRYPDELREEVIANHETILKEMEQPDYKKTSVSGFAKIKQILAAKKESSSRN